MPEIHSLSSGLFQGAWVTSAALSSAAHTASSRLQLALFHLHRCSWCSSQGISKPSEVPCCNRTALSPRESPAISSRTTAPHHSAKPRLLSMTTSSSTTRVTLTLPSSATAWGTTLATSGAQPELCMLTLREHFPADFTWTMLVSS